MPEMKEWSKKRNRPDKDGTHRLAYDRNKKKIFATQTICAICGREVDFNLKFPNPMCATIDHVIPVSRGGHPSDIENLQLAHLCCNRAKSNKLADGVHQKNQTTISNRVLPQSMDWTKFGS